MSKENNKFAADYQPVGKPIFITAAQYKPIFESASSTPCEAFTPGEAMSIREMLERTDRGQRLDVHTRFRKEGIPDNMYFGQFDKDGKLLPDPGEDTFAHTPPSDMNDIVDVQAYEQALKERKNELQKKRKESVANASKSEPSSESSEKKEQHPDAAPSEA